MLKVVKRQRNGEPTELDSPNEATLKPCFTPPSSPDRRVSTALSPLSRSSSSSSDEDSMNDFNAPKRRKTARRHYRAFSSVQTTRVEACAAAAAAADSTECESSASVAADSEVGVNSVVCPHCGHALPSSGASCAWQGQGRLYTLNDVKRVVATALSEQGNKLRLEYEKLLQQELHRQYMSIMQSQQEASRPSDYSYIS